MVAIVSEAKRHNIPVASHATSDAAIREAVEAGVASIEHAYDTSDETLRLTASDGVWLVPTDPSLEMALEFTRSWPPQPPREEVERHLQGGRDRLMRAHRAGVHIALGSELYFPYAPGRGAGSRATLEGYVEAGLTPTQALQSATWEAGRMLGDDGLGVIRPRAFADLVAVEGDPTQGPGAAADAADDHQGRAGGCGGRSRVRCQLKGARRRPVFAQRLMTASLSGHRGQAGF